MNLNLQTHERAAFFALLAERLSTEAFRALCESHYQAYAVHGTKVSDRVLLDAIVDYANGSAT